jgi:peroxiredoxin
MVKCIKFICLVLFLFSFLPACKAAGKAVPGEPLSVYEFKLNNLKGEEVSLSSYKDKKAVLIIFWTTWCPYCRDALMSLQADFQSIDSMGVELLAINVAESKNKVSKFAENLKLSFQVLLDQDSSVANRYDLLGVPTYVIVNKTGQVVFSGNRFKKARLKELTAEKE